MANRHATVFDPPKINYSPAAKEAIEAVKENLNRPKEKRYAKKEDISKRYRFSQFQICNHVAFKKNRSYYIVKDVMSVIESYLRIR